MGKEFDHDMKEMRIKNKKETNILKASNKACGLLTAQHRHSNCDRGALEKYFLASGKRKASEAYHLLFCRREGRKRGREGREGGVPAISIFGYQ